MRSRSERLRGRRDLKSDLSILKYCSGGGE
jgi:hypothetical protein